MSNSSLKDKMIGALAWSSVDRVAQQGIQFIIGIVLARLLAPDDFGLLGMIMIFATLSYVLVESGFSAALIRQRNRLQFGFLCQSGNFCCIVCAFVFYYTLFC